VVNQKNTVLHGFGAIFMLFLIQITAEENYSEWHFFLTSFGDRHFNLKSEYFQS